MTIINEKDQIKYEYETLTNALDELGVSSEKGLAELSLWGRVSELVNERDSRIAALEAQNKKLVEALQKMTDVSVAPLSKARYEYIEVVRSNALDLLSEVTQ